jgi:drug/metabolite transporter (DMT)-like permease
MLVCLIWLPVVVWVGVQEVVSWGIAEWLVLAVSAMLHVVYFRTLLHGYEVSDLTVVYPVARGSGPLLSSVGAVIVLGEAISAVGAIGALSVIAGVFLIAGGPGLWRKAHEPEQRNRVRRGLLWGALTGAFIAGYTVIDGYAVKIMLISPILVDYVGNLLRIPVMLPFVLRNRQGFVRAWRAQWRSALVVSTLGPLSYVMVLYAVRMAPLSHVAPAREVSMLFAALAGGTLLGESDRWLRLVGAAAIAAGVVALALG